MPVLSGSVIELGSPAAFIPPPYWRDHVYPVWSVMAVALQFESICVAEIVCCKESVILVN